MAESKYSLRLAAVDAYSSTFGDFSKKTDALQDGIRAQQAELQQLNRTARSVDGYAKLAEKVEGTKTALQAARVEQARLGREYQGATAKVTQLTQAHAAAAATHKQLASSTEATTAQVRVARTEEARLARELKSATGEVAKLDSAQDKATAGVRTLTAAQRGQRNELKRLQTDLTAAGVDTGKLASEQKRLEAATESANAALTAQRARLAAVHGAQGRIDDNKGKRADLRGQMVETAALAYVASRPISQAMDLETAMADVGKVITFEGNGRQEMASANLKMASDRLIASSGMTAVDLAKIEYAAGQSGIGNDVKDKDGKIDAAGKQAAVMDFTRDAAIMGSAFDIDAQTAGETMAGWRASMALNRAQTLDLADSTNYLGNSFNAKAADIAAVVKRYGAVGKASGMTPEQTAALSAALLNPGTEKEIAGTGFKNFTSALVAGKSATKGEKKQWDELGIDPEQLAADMQVDAPATIMRVLQTIKEQPVEEHAAIATTLFGSESIGAIQPLLENLSEVQRAFDMVKDKTKYATSALGENGSMMQEAAGVANTSRTGWNAFTAKLTRLSTVIGQAMLPALNFVLVPLGALADGISWLAETFPNMTGALAVAAGGVAALTLGALGLKYAGLMIGQVFNRGGLARAKLDARTGQTAIAADLAVARLNATLGRLGAGGGRGGSGGAGGAGGGGKGAAAGKGAAVATAAKGGRLARLAEWGSKFGGKYGGKLLGTALTAATVASVASDAMAAPAGAAATAANTGKAAEAIKASAAPAAAVAGKLPVGIVPPAAAGLSGPPGALKTPLSLAVAKAAAEVPLSAAPAAAAAAEAAAPGLLSKSASLGGKVLSKAATPLVLLSGGVQVAEGIANGDSGQIGAGIGGTGGALAGGAAGAAIGTMIFPGVGTVIGGAIGSFAGSEAGSWIGEKLGELVDKLKSPEATAQQVVKSTTENSKPITFSPSITMQPSGDPAYDKRMADNILARLKAELLPMMAGPDPLAGRRSASLTDGSD